MSGFLYTLFIGFPCCVILCCFAVALCCTIIGIPVGIALFMAAFKVLTIDRKQQVRVVS